MSAAHICQTCLMWLALLWRLWCYNYINSVRDRDNNIHYDKMYNVTAFASYGRCCKMTMPIGCTSHIPSQDDRYKLHHLITHDVIDCSWMHAMLQQYQNVNDLKKNANTQKRLMWLTECWCALCGSKRTSTRFLRLYVGTGNAPTELGNVRLSKERPCNFMSAHAVHFSKALGEPMCLQQALCGWQMRFELWAWRSQNLPTRCGYARSSYDPIATVCHSMPCTYWETKTSANNIFMLGAPMCSPHEPSGALTAPQRTQARHCKETASTTDVPVKIKVQKHVHLQSLVIPLGFRNAHE